MEAEISSQSDASTKDEWRTRLQEMEEIVRRLGSKEKSTTDPVDLSSQMAASRKESKGRTLLLKIHLLRYSISWEELDGLFARFGRIECIEVFCPGDQYHSRIRFHRKESAIRAFKSFNHRDIYDGCCRLELFLEDEIDDGFQEPKNRTPPHISEHRSTAASSSESWERRMRLQENLRRMVALGKKLHMEPCRSLAQASTEEDSVEESLLDEESEIEINPIEESIQKIDSSPHFIEEVDKPEICINSSMSPASLNLEGEKSEVLEVLDHTVGNDSKEQKGIHEEVVIPGSESVELTKVKSFPTIVSDYIPAKWGELVVLLIELIEMRLANFSTNSSDVLGITNAHKMFDEMPNGLIHAGMSSTEFLGTPSVHQVLEEVSMNVDMVTFDPGGLIISCFTSLRGSASNWVKDINARGFSIETQVGKIPNRSAELFWILDVAIVKQKVLIETLVFDPGIAKLGSMFSSLQPWKITCVSCWWKVSSNLSIGRVKTRIMVFDPGGEMTFMLSCICCVCVYGRGVSCHRRCCAIVLGKGWCSNPAMGGSDSLRLIIWTGLYGTCKSRGVVGVEQ